MTDDAAPAGTRPETRAPAPARAPFMRVVSVELPETDRRTPFVVVHVAVGPLVLALGVALPRSGWLSVRPPLSVTGKPAVAAEPPGLWEEIEALAIAAARDDPAAARHLTGHRSRRYTANSGWPAPPAGV
jgi:hypothetical protein